MISSRNQHNVKHLLFCPGNKPRLIDKAINSQADLVIVDWEDSVSPSAKKDARSGFDKWFKKTNKKRIDSIAIRINPPTTRQGLEDILFLTEISNFSGFLVLPKVSDYGYVSIIKKLFHNHNVKFIVLIESAEGINSLKSILEKHHEVISHVMIGDADLSADLQCDNSKTALAYAYSNTISICRQLDIPIIDSPSFNLNDFETLEEDTRYSKSIGCSAKAAIHPNQLAIIDKVYQPTTKEIKEAKEIITIAKNGVGTFQGAMVDNAMLKKAQRLLASSKNTTNNG